MELSFWEKQELNHQKQVAIIGSGIVGLTTSIYLKQKNPNIPVTILERGGMPLGASTKNAGFACFGSVSEILDDLSHMHRSEVVALVGNRYKGLQRLFSIVNKEDIEYSETGGYEIFTQDHHSSYERCLANIDLCNDLVSEATGHNRIYSVVDGDNKMHIPFPMIFNPLEGQLNPYKLIRSLTSIASALGVNIVYNCQIDSIDSVNRQLICNHKGYSISYGQLVICTNGFARKLIGDLEVFPARNQVLITDECEIPFPEGCYHYNKGYVYFRNYKNRILLGGGRNLNIPGEQTDKFGTTDQIRSYLLSFLYDVINVNRKVEIAHWWSGIMGVGNSKETIVKEYLPGHYLGVRLGGMGVALGSEVGHKLADMIVIP